MTGLSSGANILVTGPGGYNTTIATTTMLENLAVGDYTLEAAPAGNHFVSSGRTQVVTVAPNAATTATITYASAFEFSATADATVLSLGETTELAGTLAGLHADLTDVNVTLATPSGWNLSVTGPWIGVAAEAIGTFATDTAADLGTNDFVFTITGTLGDQELEHVVTASVDLQPVVTTGADNLASPLAGSLRYMVESPRVEGHTITFDPALASSGVALIELQEELEVRQALNISGYADPAVTVRIGPAAGATTRLLYIRPPAGTTEPPTVELSRLEFVGGAVTGNNDGGAINSVALLTITDSAFVGNQGRYGGAVAVAGGSLTARNVRFEDNVASQWGGALYASNTTTVELLGSTFRTNQASNGGAVMTGSGSPSPENRVSVLIEDTDFSNNLATAGGGAYTNYGNATVRGSTFRDNLANSGGAIRNHYRLTIEDDTAVLDNEATTSYGGILNDGIMAVIDSEVSGNAASAGDGGGIYNGYADGDFRVDGTDIKSLTIINSLIADNRATGNGGGIYNVQRLEVEGSTFDANRANGSGGGVYSTTPVGSDATNLRGNVLVTNSTFSENHAVDFSGGAIAVEFPAAAPAPEFVMTNSTVANNAAYRDGGGIALTRLGGGFGDPGVTGSISFSTIAYNVSTDGEGGGIYTAYSDLTLRGNLIASNETLKLAGNDFEFDLFDYSGSAASQGYNWITTDPQFSITGTTGDVLGEPTDLGALANNGGPTQTIRPALTPVGRALGDVPWSECRDVAGNQLTVDQRGYSRPGPNTTCYRGALEEESAPL